ncbi:hypothetical protein [Neorhizobium sp. JUb45]|uniref:hypothetical protein n=1 Tax=Neorhizobium sp. JUb45 TaxID=2485113 RepID=UPI00104A9EE6|nr:hypothetical protein [Neorhizobium sp. JUb45]TCR07269.1 hypothetical protein EDF70_1011242 [Neorhizobium sp. JUb45]
MATTPNVGLDLPVDTANIDTEIYRLLSNLQLLDTTIGALQTLAAGKAPIIHAHELSDITGLVTALNNKMAASKTFALADLTDTRNIAGAPAGYILVKQSDGKVEPVSAPSVFGTFLLRIDSAQALTEAQKSQVIENIFTGLTVAQKGQAIANIGGGVLAGHRNKLINGNFNIAQRGTTFAQAAAVRYAVDRWRLAASNGATIGMSRMLYPKDIPSIPEDTEAYGRFDFTQSADASHVTFVDQAIEDVGTLAGKRATLTFNAAGNVSLIGVVLIQIFGAGGSPLVNIGARQQAISAINTKYSLLFDIPSVAGKTIGSGSCLIVRFIFSSGANYDAAGGKIVPQTGNVNLTRASLVEGDASKEDDPFSPRHIQQELELCKRYYQITPPIGLSGPTIAGYGNSIVVPFSPEMRAQPTIVVFASGTASGSMTTGGVDAPQKTSIRYIAGNSGTGGGVIYGDRFAADAEI